MKWQVFKAYQPTHIFFFRQIIMRATERNLKKSPSFTKENLFFFHETFGDLFFGLNVKTFP